METNFQLEDKLNKYGLDKMIVTTKDRLHQYVSRPRSAIVNLQDDYDSNGTDLNGTHWTACYIEDNKECCYFDPIGVAPPSEVQLYLYHYRPYPYSAQQVQDASRGWCGSYCLMFLWFMANNKQITDMSERLEKFLKLFLPSDLGKNEVLLKKYLGE